MMIPLMMCGIWFAAPAGMLTAAVSRVDEQRQVHDDGPEVEGADLGAGDRRDRERRAFERAGEVDLAGGVGEDGADARADEGVADFARGGTRWFCFLLRAALGACERDVRFGAERDAGEVRGQARRVVGWRTL